MGYGGRMRRRTHGFDDFVDEAYARAHFLVRIRNNQTMQILLRIIRKRIRPRLTLLNTPLAPDRNLRPALPLHLLQTVSSRSNQKAEEIDLGELFDGNVDLFLRAM